MFCPPSPIYRGKEGGGCRPARPGELGCFQQKAPSSVGTSGKAHVGLISICTPLFTKYTPSSFFADSFSVTLLNFTNYVTILVFVFFFFFFSMRYFATYTCVYFCEVFLLYTCISKVSCYLNIHIYIL